MKMQLNSLQTKSVICFIDSYLVAYSRMFSACTKNIPKLTAVLLSQEYGFSKAKDQTWLRYW